jgi:hypothetical protein
MGRCRHESGSVAPKPGRTGVLVCLAARAAVRSRPAAGFRSALPGASGQQHRGWPAEAMASPAPPWCDHRVRGWGVAWSGCRRGGVITVPPLRGVVTVTTPPVTVGEGVSATVTTPLTRQPSTGQQPAGARWAAGLMAPTSAFGRDPRPVRRRPARAWRAR